MLYLSHSRQNCFESVSENQTGRNSNMLDQNVQSAIIKMARKIDAHSEVKKNIEAETQHKAKVQEQIARAMERAKREWQ